MKRVFIALLSLAALCGCDDSDDKTSDNGKVYKIEDTYSENGKVGTVFWVTEDGRHGKIFSERSAEEMLWSTENVVTGATDEDYGMNNMTVIRQIEGWREKYPAFAWCADLGEGWYLPSKNELLTLDRAGIILAYEIDLWSSTEFDEERACFVSVYTQTTGTFRKTKYPAYVIAVSEF